MNTAMTRHRYDTGRWGAFINLARAIRSLPGLPRLDPVEERLLNELAASWYAGLRVTVTDAAALLAEGSARTTYRRLHALRQKGMIDLRTDEDDQRLRYVVPTRLAIDYFDSLGQLVARVAGR